MYTCFKCKKLIKPVSLAANVNGESYHPQCISCFKCGTNIFGKPFKKARDGKVYCEQECHAIVHVQNSEQTNMKLDDELVSQSKPNEELTNKYKIENTHSEAKLNTPRDSSKSCKLCSQLVNGKTFITYENGDILCYTCEYNLKNKPARLKSAHIIICSFCNCAVHGRRYFTEPNGKIICEECEVVSEKCSQCKRPLKIDENGFKTLKNGAHIHVKCISCSDCSKPIGQHECFEHNDRFLCLNCFEIDKLLKCCGCKRPISELYLMIDDQPYHKECFKCTSCERVLAQGADYFKDTLTKLPLCSTCNLTKNGEKCFKCNQVVDKDGYTFANHHYHGDCFKCVHCGVELWKMKQSYVGRDENEICCEPCFSQRFCDKCEKCGQTISLHIPGVKYEDKMYHRECLACGRCKKSLVGKKFFKSGKILICEQCY